MIRFERYHMLSDVMWDHLCTLYCQLDNKRYFSDPLFIKACTEYWASIGKITILLVAFDSQNKPVGFIALYKTNLQIHGIRFDCFVNASYPVADLNPIFCLHIHFNAFVNGLINELRQLTLPCILFNIPESDKRQLCSNIQWVEGVSTINPYYVGDVKHLSSKKSLNRHYSKFHRTGEFVVEHYQGQDSLKYLDAFFTMHIQRWLTAGVKSGFQDKEIVDLYKAIVSAPTLASNYCMLTVLKLKDDYLAFHLGFVDETVFLWHSPCFNVSFLPEWPGEVLLKSVLDYAEKTNLSEFDLGVGDEWYKNRFSNNSRHCYSVLYFQSFLTKYKYALGRFASQNKSLKLFFSVISKVKSKSFSELISAIRERLYCKVVWYNLKQDKVLANNKYLHNKFSQLTFFEYSQVWKASEEKPPYLPNKATIDRFESDWKLFAYKDGKSFSFGWVVPKGELYVFEVGVTVIIPDNSIVIVDCWTSPSGRGKGLYGNLLSGILTHFNDAINIFIYAESHNKASLKGIEKAGGKFSGYIRRFLKNKTVTNLMLEVK